MKQTLGLLILIFGLSFSVQAKFFNFERPGIKCGPERDLVTIKNFDLPLPTPKYVFAEGEYHPITSNIYPFYTPHELACTAGPCYNPNMPAPLGSLWKKTIYESSFMMKSGTNDDRSSISFNYRMDIKPVHKLCSGCKRPALKPGAAFHLKNSERMTYYFNGM